MQGASNVAARWPHLRVDKSLIAFHTVNNDRTIEAFNPSAADSHGGSDVIRYRTNNIYILINFNSVGGSISFWSSYAVIQITCDVSCKPVS